MPNIIEKVSYIFRYKEAGEERKQAQVFIISYLRKCFPALEIIVVEQGEKQTLFLPEAWNVRLILEEYTGIFNRCRPYNIGAAASSRPILAFGDGDIFLKKEDYLSCFEATKNFDAVTPNKDLVLNVEIEDLEKHTFKFLNNRRVNAFAGGLLVLTRAAFDKIGGWDERFIAWGHEDLAMSHLIFQTLKSKTFFLDFYHIDHPRTLADTTQHSGININEELQEEIATFNGQAMQNYIQILKQQRLSNKSEKVQKLRFVLAISARNGLESLQKLIDSFLKTKSSDVDWTLLISDKGAADGVRDWVENLQVNCAILLLKNDKIPFLRQENRLLKKLSELDFDLCFKSSDETVFVKSGWEKAYWEVIKKTGYDHLIFYDRKREELLNSDFPVERGSLTAACSFENTEGLFFTLTPRVLQQTGFMDEQLLRNQEGVIDYICRACRLGFNVLQYPFDLKNSHEFIQLQATAKTSIAKEKNRSAQLILKDMRFVARQLIRGNRGYLPYNENDFTKEYHSIKGAIFETERQENKLATSFKKCDARYYPNRGVAGFIGFLIRRLYNFGIDYQLYFIPRKIKSLGKSFMKMGEDLVRIDF